MNSNMVAIPPSPTVQAALAGRTTESADPGIPDYGSVSPETLMLYCQTRLGSIDDQVKSAFQQQQHVSDETAALKSIADDLRNGQGDDKWIRDPKVAGAIDTKLQNLVKTIQKNDPGSPILGDLQALSDKLHKSTDDGIFSDTDIQDYQTNLQSAMDDLNSNAQLQMIQLQSLMSQRQTAISLTTNLVQSLGDQTNKIADNIGH